jgi:ribonuclease P protein component
LRVAFSVGRSYGRATERNRLRRRLRAIVQQAAAEQGIVSGFLLLGAKPHARELTFEQLRQQVRELLRRTHDRASMAR